MRQRQMTMNEHKIVIQREIQAMKRAIMRECDLDTRFRMYKTLSTYKKDELARIHIARRFWKDWIDHYERLAAMREVGA